MTISETSPKRVLIISANPLFQNGLRQVYVRRWGERAVVVGMPSNMQDALQALDQLSPDLVILDYDDKMINREEFLKRFVAFEVPMKIVLVSLNKAGSVEVYDRRNLSLTEADDWLEDPWIEDLP